MVQWWEAAHALLLEYRFNRSFITAAVRQAIQQHKLTYRPAAAQLISYCHSTPYHCWCSVQGWVILSRSSCDRRVRRCRMWMW